MMNSKAIKLKGEKAMSKRKKKGFTLIELIVVIAILGILAAVALTRFADIRVNSQAEANRSTAVQVVNAAETYFQNTGIEPTIATLVSNNYLRSTPVGTFVLSGTVGNYACSYTVPAGADTTKYDGSVP